MNLFLTSLECQMSVGPRRGMSNLKSRALLVSSARFTLHVSRVLYTLFVSRARFALHVCPVLYALLVSSALSAFSVSSARFALLISSALCALFVSRVIFALLVSSYSLFRALSVSSARFALLVSNALCALFVSSGLPVRCLHFYFPVRVRTFSLLCVFALFISGVVGCFTHFSCATYTFLVMYLCVFPIKHHFYDFHCICTALQVTWSLEEYLDVGASQWTA